MSERDFLSRLEEIYKPGKKKKPGNEKGSSKPTLTPYGVVEGVTPCQIQRYIENQNLKNDQQK